jgi:hypothetical protein
VAFILLRMFDPALWAIKRSFRTTQWTQPHKLAAIGITVDRQAHLFSTVAPVRTA